jgi:hypothetical protein
VCDSPVLINWKSRDGKDCCSRECQKKAEEDSMTDTETTDTTTEQKPITAGAAAPAKKSGKKAAPKAAPKAKTPAVPKTAKATAGRLGNEGVIHINAVKMKNYASRGGRAVLLGLIKDGMKISKYKEVFSASKSAEGHTVSGELGHAVRAGLIKIGK